MPIIPKNNQEFQNPPVWSHGAYLIGIYDMGTQPWSAKFPEPKRQVKLHFELPFEKGMFDWVEKPLAIWATYTLSTHENARFTKVFEALFQGTPTEDDYTNMDFYKLIGSPCTVTIVQNGEYVNVEQVWPLTKGITLPEVFNELKVIDLDKFDQSTFEKLGEKMKAKIASSPEFQKLEDAVFVPPVDTYTDWEPLPF